MNNTHIHFEISDPRWLVVLAGTVVEARIGAFKGVNKPFTVSFSKEDKFSEYLGQFFEAVPKDVQPYALPAEEQYAVIDYFQAAVQSKNLLEQHGIQQEPMVMPLYLAALAANSLLLSHGISSKQSYYFPRPSKGVLQDIPDSDILIEREELRGLATAFAAGLGINDPVIISASDYDDFTAAMAYFKTKAIVARPWHFLQYVARAQYEGFDKIQENIPVLSIVDNTVSVDNRFILSWNAQLPAYFNESPDSIKSKGSAWKLRQEYSFDHRKFYKAQAKSNGN